MIPLKLITSFLILFKNMDQRLCGKCGKTFPGVLKRHDKDAHKDVLTPCPHCNKICQNLKQMENHLNTNRTLVCIGCNIEIPKNSKSSHVCGDSPVFKCGQCDYESNQKCNLKRHNNDICDKHLKKAFASHVSHNSLRAGFSPARDLIIRKPSPAPVKIVQILFNLLNKKISDLVFTFLTFTFSFRQFLP